MTLGYPHIFVCPLDSLSAFYKWHDAHARPASSDRRRYAQQPLHRAAFMRTCSYTERFVHRESFTHRLEKRTLRPNLHCCCTYLSCSPSQVSNSPQRPRWCPAISCRSSNVQHRKWLSLTSGQIKRVMMMGTNLQAGWWVRGEQGCHTKDWQGSPNLGVWSLEAGSLTLGWSSVGNVGTSLPSRRPFLVILEFSRPAPPGEILQDLFATLLTHWRRCDVAILICTIQRGVHAGAPPWTCKKFEGMWICSRWSWQVI